MTEAYLVAATRTAGARRGGKFKDQHPVDLAAAVLNDLLARSGCDPALVDDVILGCVSQAGEQSTNVARNAVLASGLPETIPGTSIDRQCGSSQQALQFAAQAVMSGTMDVVIAGGVESMSRVPMGMPHALPRAQGLGAYLSPQINARYGNVEFSQFDGAEIIAERFGFTREAMDAFALDSHRKAAAATAAGKFKQEILVVEVDGVPHATDEGIRADTSLEALGGLKLLREGGRVTAGNASQICDGASGVLVVSERGLKRLGVAPLARVHHMSVLGGDPVTMLDVPLAATERALRRAGMKIGEIDLFEVNEAFACVPMAWLKATGADPNRLNVHGGAIALGHPLGASGTKLMTTLLSALHDRNKRFGLQTMCEGGGQANVTIVERL
ncbi:acetyl-CoA C-acetyltransferase [Roseiterribacter gracilis]|uniref:Acetyl-CoA acetyltransferase n=1 Tax=Roseiterribacter gracilis TaxID=2812848 RepID=A0A8S8XB40_9PROT|nr:acetyl-CoA acetyltransferase [Rhodospirillales bacterium TMPK1]